MEIRSRLRDKLASPVVIIFISLIISCHVCELVVEKHAIITFFMSEACFCLAKITLDVDTNDDSCTHGDVVSSGNPVSFSSAPVPDNAAGYFSGESGQTHLNVSMRLSVVINSYSWSYWSRWHNPFRGQFCLQNVKRWNISNLIILKLYLTTIQLLYGFKQL